MKRRLLLVSAAALVCVCNYWPQWAFNRHFRSWLGHPRYAGSWIFVEHLLLSCSLPALLSVLLWWQLARAGWLPPLRASLRKRPAIFLGVAGGLVPLAAALGMVAVADPKSLGWIPPSVWPILGNLFSNFYEELVFRGFLLLTLEAAFGFWPAAILSGVAFGAGHLQFPIPLRALIGGSGVLWCWLRRRTGSLWTPYLSHEIVDVIGDLFVK